MACPVVLCFVTFKHLVEHMSYDLTPTINHRYPNHQITIPKPPMLANSTFLRNQTRAKYTGSTVHVAPNYSLIINQYSIALSRLSTTH